MKADEIAKRHLLAVEGLQNPLQAQEKKIRIVVAESWASSHAGQLLTSCLVNLLCRQVKLVRSIEVVSPKTPTLIKLPCGDSSRCFPACLEDLGTWAVNGVVPVTTLQSGTAVDFTLFAGEAPREPDQGSGIVAIGTGWKAWVGDLSREGPSVEPVSPNPLGPFLAAALAAGEIFKRARGIRRGRFLSSNGYSLWSGTSSEAWVDLDDGPETTGATLTTVHIVGAGAVGNALAYIVASLGLSDGYFVSIDDDYYDSTNLNRCLLAGWMDQEERKVGAIARTLSANRIGCFPFSGTIKSYVADSRSGLRAEVARQVDDLFFQIVVSCVDKGVSRQDVQGLGPQLLLGGSTLNLQAKSNLYSARPGAACLACFNPAEKDGEKIRTLEDQLRKMPTQQRAEFLSSHGLDPVAIEEYLMGARCGGFGEEALRSFVTRPPAEFSAGFVSLGAGLLLASALLRSTAFSALAPARGDMSTLNFLNGGFIDAWLAADDSCEQSCQSRFRT